MELQGKNLIGFQGSAEGNSTFKSFSPQKGEHVGNDFYCATTSEVDKALQLAEEAFPRFKKVSPENRADFLEQIGEEILQLGDDLIKQACMESALPTARIEGERSRTIAQINSFANLIREGSWVEATIDCAVPDRQPLPKPDVRKLLVPTGPVVVFGASNFPLAFSTAGGDTASALAAGNPVIVKSHAAHAGTGELVARAILKAAHKTGMPEGVFSFLQDSGFDVGQQLVKAPQVKAVAFTGSLRGGMALYQLANNRPDPIPVFAEMGSINPVIFLPSALEKQSKEYAELYAASITQGCGQFCVNPGLMIAIESPELDIFEENLIKNLGAVAASSMLTGSVFQNYQKEHRNALNKEELKIFSSTEHTAKEKNLEVIPSLAVISAKKFILNSSLQDEIFGPYSLLVRCKDKNEMNQVCASLRGQLTATVMGAEDDFENFEKAISQLAGISGRVIFNGTPIGVEVCSSMHHGGPFPATTDSRFTSVGTSAIKRFVRPLAFQNCPQSVLPNELKDGNPMKIWRSIDDQWTKDPV